MKCEDCKFAVLYGEPKLEDYPKGLFISNIAKAVVEDINESRVYRYEKIVVCKRFPKFEDKLKTDWCGEYQV